MGLYFRKSVRMGPFRLNFSGSGIGMSAGIPGFRVGTGPRGNYIQMGAHGIYYRAALPSNAARSASARTERRPPANPIDEQKISPQIPEGTVGAFQAVESVDAAMLVDSSSEQLLQEIRKKHKQVRSWPYAAAATIIYLWLAATNAFPTWSLIAGAVAGFAILAFAYRWDIMRKLVVLHYELVGQSAKSFEAFVDSASHIATADRIWHIAAAADVKDAKYHAGASLSLVRKKASFAKSQPPYVASNLDPVTLVLSKSTFYFFPDRLLVYSGGHVGSVSYESLHAAASVFRFIEGEGVPSDSKVVDRTWRYVNKSGGPDKRFKDNRELPICAYGHVALKSESGINELLLISRQGPENAFAEAVSHLAWGTTRVKSTAS